MFERSEAISGPYVEKPQVSVLAASVYYVLLLPKTSHRCDISLKIAIVGSRRLVRPFKIVYFCTVIHADDYLAFVLCDLNAIWS